MTIEQILVLVIVVIAALIIFGDSRRWIMRRFFSRPRPDPEPAPQPRTSPEMEQRYTEAELRLMTAEEKSESEIKRLENLIEDQKQIARDTDISYHLWNLYESHFRDDSGFSSGNGVQNGKWYDVTILKSSTRNGLKKIDFELMGKRYTFADDEEQQGWRDQIKLFSLFLYDDSGRCLFENPMKIRVDGDGRKYSILSHGPEAFLQGDWVKNFINVNLKHQHMRNQDFREQKLQERLREIEELKGRFGIPD